MTKASGESLEEVPLRRGPEMHPQAWETQAAGSLLPFLWSRPEGLLAGKGSSSMTKRTVRSWSFCKFPKFIVIVFILYLLL